MVQLGAVGSSPRWEQGKLAELPTAPRVVRVSIPTGAHADEVFSAQPHHTGMQPGSMMSVALPSRPVPVRCC